MGEDRQIVYIIERNKVVSKRTRNPERLAEKLGTKVYTQERFAKCALTKLTKTKLTKTKTKTKRAKRKERFDYTLTRASVSVVLGKRSETILPTDPRYNKIRKACIDRDIDTVRKLINLDKVIEKGTKGAFKTKKRGRQILIDGEEVPKELADKIGRMMKQKQPTDAFLAFWRRLKKNPDKQVRDSLYRFIAKIGCAFTTDGFILAYKYVDSEYHSVYKSKRVFNWTPGNRVRMPRSECNSNPNEACSTGLHTGTIDYVGGHGDIRLLVKIDPKDVVCVPYDDEFEKMRCCCIYSVCHAEGELPTDLVDAEAVKKWTGQKIVAYKGYGG